MITRTSLDARPASTSRPLARTVASTFALVLALVLYPMPAVEAAPALPADVPTLIDSDTLEYDDANQISVFTGNVVLTRGNLTLHAHRLELRQNPEGDQFAVAIAGPGKQVFVRQEQPNGVEVIEGYADRAEYDSPREQLEFIGHAVVSRLACGELLDQVKGELIRYNQASNTYSAVGGPRAGTANQRVRTMIQSKEKSQAIISSCPGGKGGTEGGA